MRPIQIKMLLVVVFLACGATADASTTWYVNGVSGHDSNNCLSVTTPCKTIGHAISLALSGDTIRVAAATYNENLTLGTSLRIIGAGARTTIVDGGRAGRVIAINTSNAKIAISGFTIRNGRSDFGGGIFNAGTLTVSNTTVSGNIGTGSLGTGIGAGIGNTGTVTITSSTISGNRVSGPFGAGLGGGLGNEGTAIVTNSTLSGNTSTASGGGISNPGTLTINNSTLSGNSAVRSGGNGYGGGISNGGTVTINNSTEKRSKSRADQEGPGSG